MEPQNGVKKSELVKLNVSGKRYITTRSTLSKCGANFFTQMLEHADSGKLTRETDEKGYIFIDRNGELFEYVLDYLRNGVLICSKKMKLRRRVGKELEFYGLGSELNFAKLREKIGKELDKSALVIENSIRRVMDEGKSNWELIHSVLEPDPDFDSDDELFQSYKSIGCLRTPEKETIDIDVNDQDVSIHVFRDEFKKRWGISCGWKQHSIPFSLEDFIYA